MKLVVLMLGLVATTCAMPAKDSVGLLKRHRQEASRAEEAEQLKLDAALLLKHQSDSTSTADDILKLLEFSALYNDETSPSLSPELLLLLKRNSEESAQIDPMLLLLHKLRSSSTAEASRIFLSMNQGNGLSDAQKLLINALRSSEPDRVEQELLHDEREERESMSLEQILLHKLRFSSISEASLILQQMFRSEIGLSPEKQFLLQLLQGPSRVEENALHDARESESPLSMERLLLDRLRSASTSEASRILLFMNHGKGLSDAQKLLINALRSSEPDRVEKELLHDEREERESMRSEQILLHKLRSSSNSEASLILQQMFRPEFGLSPEQQFLLQLLQGPSRVGEKALHDARESESPLSLGRLLLNKLRSTSTSEASIILHQILLPTISQFSAKELLLDTAQGSGLDRLEDILFRDVKEGEEDLTTENILLHKLRSSSISDALMILEKLLRPELRLNPKQQLVLSALQSATSSRIEDMLVRDEGEARAPLSLEQIILHQLRSRPTSEASTILQHILLPEISPLSAQQLLLQFLQSSGSGAVEEMLLHSDKEGAMQSPEQFLLHRIRRSSTSDASLIVQQMLYPEIELSPEQQFLLQLLQGPSRVEEKALHDARESESPLSLERLLLNRLRSASTSEASLILQKMLRPEFGLSPEQQFLLQSLEGPSRVEEKVMRDAQESRSLFSLERLLLDRLRSASASEASTMLQRVLFPEISQLSAKQLLLEILQHPVLTEVYRLDRLDDILLKDDREDQEPLNAEQILLHKLRSSSTSDALMILEKMLRPEIRLTTTQQLVLNALQAATSSHIEDILFKDEREAGAPFSLEQIILHQLRSRSISEASTILQHILLPEISPLSAQQFLLQVLQSSGPGAVEEMLLHSNRETALQNPEKFLLHMIRSNSMSEAALILQKMLRPEVHLSKAQQLLLDALQGPARSRMEEIVVHDEREALVNAERILLKKLRSGSTSEAVSLLQQMVHLSIGPSPAQRFLLNTLQRSEPDRLEDTLVHQATDSETRFTDEQLLVHKLRSVSASEAAELLHKYLRTDVTPVQQLLLNSVKETTSTGALFLRKSSDAQSSISPEMMFLLNNLQSKPSSAQEYLLLRLLNNTTVPQTAKEVLVYRRLEMAALSREIESYVLRSITRSGSLSLEERLLVQHHVQEMEASIRRLRLYLLVNEGSSGVSETANGGAADVEMKQMTAEQMHTEELLLLRKRMTDTEASKREQELAVEILMEGRDMNLQILLALNRRREESILPGALELERAMLRARQTTDDSSEGSPASETTTEEGESEEELGLREREKMLLLQNENMNEMWILYKHRYNKKYSKLEDVVRKAIFIEKATYVMTHNFEARQGKHSFSMALNNLTDRTTSEMGKLLGYRYITKPTLRTKRQTSTTAMQTYSNTVDLSTLPATVNWTAQGWVGPVLNQGQCGSCWAFSAAAALEAQYFNKTKGPYVQLSEQNLVDCTGYLGNNECNGGAYQYAFQYVMDVGIESLAAYPYTGLNGTCMYTQANSVTSDNGWQNVAERSEPALQQAVALVGPVSVAIDASLPSFQLYTSGVYAETLCSSTKLDHAVLAVGYGTYNGQDYWLLKNSWGTDWGMDGYMMMARNDGNMCGVATEPAFPLIN